MCRFHLIIHRCGHGSISALPSQDCPLAGVYLHSTLPELARAPAPCHPLPADFAHPSYSIGDVFEQPFFSRVPCTPCALHDDTWSMCGPIELAVHQRRFPAMSAEMARIAQKIVQKHNVVEEAVRIARRLPAAVKEQVRERIVYRMLTDREPDHERRSGGWKGHMRRFLTNLSLAYYWTMMLPQLASSPLPIWNHERVCRDLACEYYHRAEAEVSNLLQLLTALEALAMDQSGASSPRAFLENVRACEAALMACNADPRFENSVAAEEEAFLAAHAAPVPSFPPSVRSSAPKVKPPPLDLYCEEDDDSSVSQGSAPMSLMSDGSIQAACTPTRQESATDAAAGAEESRSSMDSILSHISVRPLVPKSPSPKPSPSSIDSTEADDEYMSDYSDISSYSDSDYVPSPVARAQAAQAAKDPLLGPKPAGFMVRFWGKDRHYRLPTIPNEEIPTPKWYVHLPITVRFQNPEPFIESDPSHLLRKRKHTPLSTSSRGPCKLCNDELDPLEFCSGCTPAPGHRGGAPQVSEDSADVSIHPQKKVKLSPRQSRRRARRTTSSPAGRQNRH